MAVRLVRDDEDLFDDDIDGELGDVEQGPMPDDEDAYDSDEGIFEDTESVFDTPRRPSGRVEHANPQITREEEIQNELPPKKRTKPQKRQLIAIFDQRGMPKVAMTVNGNRIENFRAPTKVEWEALRDRGVIVQAPTAVAPVGAVVAPTTLGEKLKPIAKLAAIAAVAGGAWYMYNKFVTEDDELDDDAEDI